MYMCRLYKLHVGEHSQRERYIEFLFQGPASCVLWDAPSIGKYGSTSYIGMTPPKKAANRKGIGLTTLKHACNSTTNTRTKYLLVVMHKTLCSVWLTFVLVENKMVQNCLLV